MGKRKTYGFSWSWKRAIGLSGLRNRIARATGIPTTKSGWERKIGRVLINTLLQMIKKLVVK